MSPVGAALILLACLAAAWRLTQEQTKRLRALQELSAALERLGADMSLRLTGLPELTEALAQSAPGAAGRFFCTLREALSELGEKPFAVLWAETLRSALPELGREELDALLRLGETLGRYELNEQLAAIELCRAALERGAALLRDALPERRRLAYGLLGAAGALLCILLI